MRDVDGFAEAMADGRFYWQGQHQQPPADYWRADVGLDYESDEGLAEILVSRSPTEEEFAWTPHGTEVETDKAIGAHFGRVVDCKVFLTYNGFFRAPSGFIPATNVLTQLRGMSTKLGGDRAVLTGVKFAIEDGDSGSLEVEYGNESLCGTISGGLSMTLASDFMSQLFALAEGRLNRYLRDQSSA